MAAWLQRLRALKNIQVIESAPAAAGGDHDFSEYAVRNAYEAGRVAVANWMARHEEQRPQLRSAA